jgi:hypothetical protein
MKLLNKIKSILFWLKKNALKILIPISMLIGFLTSQYLGNSQKGKIKYNKKYKPVPEDKTKIVVKDSKGNKEKIDLPKHPETENQIAVDEIDQAGLPEKTKENLNVKNKTKSRNRRTNSN